MNESLEILGVNILNELQLPELEKNGDMLNNGIELSANYNQVSLDYSSKKLNDQEYLLKLFDFSIKYEKYMTAIDSYIDDILILKKSMMNMKLSIVGLEQLLIRKNYKITKVLKTKNGSLLGDNSIATYSINTHQIYKRNNCSTSLIIPCIKLQRSYEIFNKF